MLSISTFLIMECKPRKSLQLKAKDGDIIYK